MSITIKEVSRAVGYVLDGRPVAVVFSKDLATRVRAKFKGKRPRKGARITAEIAVTVGKPNYAEREFLKVCKKAGTRPKSVWFPSPSK